jgi:shikimate kinase
MVPPLTQGVRPAPPAGRALVFTGFMGAGKTTAARRLAKAFGLEVTDADAAIAEHIGMPIDRCFAERGEAAFREIEAELVGEMLEQA